MLVSDRTRRTLARRRRLALASAHLLFFSLLGALALGSPRGWMPGPLSQEHEFTGDRCDACHAPAGDVASRCANCHEAATLERPWKEHRHEEAKDGSAWGPLSRAAGVGGILGLAALASGLTMAAAVLWPRRRVRLRLRPKR
jgi:hypothetical protein